MFISNIKLLRIQSFLNKKSKLGECIFEEKQFVFNNKLYHNSFEMFTNIMDIRYRYIPKILFAFFNKTCLSSNGKIQK